MGNTDNPHLKLAMMGAETWNRWARTFMDDEAIDELNLTDERRGKLKSILPFNRGEENGVSIKLGLDSLDELDRNADFKGLEIECDFSEFWFSGETDFTGATFSEIARFTGATFSGIADFIGATFSVIANFAGATFSEIAYFTEATFSGFARFTGATFSGFADFIGATFSGVADFAEATFSGFADFTGATFSEFADFIGATFSESADFAGATFSEIAYFTGATFSGLSIFNNCVFKNSTYFKGTTFYQPPCFHGADLHQNTSFHNAIYKYIIGNEDDARAWRTLKLAMNKIHNHDQELMFFKYEMDARRVVLKEKNKHINWFLIGLYKLVSDYGTSVFKPLYGLALSWFLFSQIYGFISCDDGSLSWAILVEDYCFKGFQLSTANLLPFVPSSKAAVSAVFSNGDGMGFGMQLMTVVESVISLAFIFLIGLALKHKFSIK